MGTEGKMEHHDGDLRFEESALRSVTEVLRSARTIRMQLGEKHTVLDDYLKNILTAISESVMTTETARHGFEDAFIELRGLCRNLRNGNNEEAEKHLFYPVAKAFLDKQAIPQGAAYYEACCIGMFSEFTEFAVRSFQEEYDSKLHAALLENHVVEAKAALGVEIGQPAADVFHESILKCFVAVPQTRIFTQALIDQAVSSLLVREGDTGNYVFQHILG